jgi:hypothetical protein
LLCTLSACARTTASGVPTSPLDRLSRPEVKPVASSFCSLADPFHWSARDTDASIAQAKAHNAKGVALCGWGRPPAATSDPEPPH